MGIIAGICVVALVMGLVLGLNNCQGTTDPTVEPTPSGTANPTDPTDEPTKPPKETEATKPTDPPVPGGISYYSGMPDYSWYDEDEIYEEYTLYTADQFMAFADLVNVKGIKFQGVIIKLGANLVFNNGDASKWSKDDNELLKWTPIGSKEANYFAGTLDGQGYYISGLFGVKGRDNGFMLYTQKATIQNLAIINSYFANTGGNQKDAQVLGTFVGRGYGVTLKNLYTDAILEGGGYNTGGIVGFARDTWTQNKTEDAKDVLIDSCVFAGTIKGCVGVNVGGILGGTDGVNAKLISNCLNLGSIESSKGTVGGIAGAIQKDTVVTNCVNAGKVVSKEKSSDRVALIGNVPSSSTVQNSYFANVPGAKPFGSGTPAGSGVMGVDRASMKGANVSKVMTALDFKTVWTAYKDGYPIPTGVVKMYDEHKKAVDEDAGNGGPVYKNPSAAAPVTVDTSWYKEGEKTFTLTTADQLYGFAKLINEGKTNFKGVTIKLGADIVVNQGDASKWNAETAGLRPWTPVGTGTSKYFAGTLDGQGHYISGLFTVVDRDSGFICYAFDATVKNLAIVNSYFENFGRLHSSGYLSAQVLGTFVGRGYGVTLQNLYSDARIVVPETAQSYNTGGIAGFAKSNGTQGDIPYGASRIESCVFAGTITTNNENDALTGGILGSTDGSFTVIKNCLNRGQINAKGSLIGGIAGKLDKASVLEDCVNVGNVSNKVGLVGTVTDTVEVTDCYYVKFTGSKAYGGGTPATNGVTSLTRDQMKGTNVGTVMTGLDFKAAWTALKDDYPIPIGVKAMYAKHKQPIPGGESDGAASGGESGGESGGTTHVPGTPDTTWYKDGETSFTLTTADQLFGFAELVNEGILFEGVTIKLGADIVINEGEASGWKTTAPARKWTPIGTGSSAYFAGIFDGQGHYISGLYTAEKQNNGLFGWAANAEIKNLAIINSYFSTIGRDNGGNGQMLAAFAARTYGTTLKNLYTNAILEYAPGADHKGDWCTAGIVGIASSPALGKTEDSKDNITFTKQSILENCVFAGKIITNEANSTTGAAVGGILGSANGKPVTIKNCLFVGEIDSNDKQVGGIAALIYDGSTVEGCVSIGKMTATAATPEIWGAVVGQADGTTTIQNCYYSAEQNLPLYGKKATVNGESTNTELAADKLMGTQVTTTMANLTFGDDGWSAQENDYPVPTAVKAMYQANKKPHTHAWSESWTSDENGHWHTCGNVGCDITDPTQKKDYGAHVFDNDKDKDCATCGYVRIIPDANDGAIDGSLSKPSGYIGGDNSWYKPDSDIKEYTLTNVDQLFGFAYLVNIQGHKFEGITVKLGSNMVINEGDASTWGTTPPALVWHPVGTQTTPFMGTFDGQGHYISGLYTCEKQNNGLFAWIANAEIKNVAIINSYFKTIGRDGDGNGQMLAAFAARAYGTSLKNLYTDATLHYAADATHKGDWCTAGIAAIVTSPKIGTTSETQDNINVTGKGKIENCVFAGSILTGTASKNTGAGVGGILGSANGKPISIKNCLFIGKIESNDKQVGGIAAIIANGCTIESSVSAGTMTATAEGLASWGAVVGETAGTTSVKNCYYSAAQNLPLYGKKATLNDEATNTELTDAKMKGLQVTNTMFNLTLGEAGWTAQEGDYPVPSIMKTMVNALRKLTADAQAPVINTQPTMDNLTVGAESVDGGALTYQWYKSTDGVNFEAIQGATDATYTHDASITGDVWYKCEVTNTNNNTASAVKTAKVDSVVVKVHIHVYDTTMSHNENGHWYACTVAGCDAAVESLPNYEAHVYSGDDDASCNVTGCGYERHVHSWKTEWETNDTHHWHECANAGCPVTKDEEKDGYHAHSFVTVGAFPECETCHYKLLVSYYSGNPDKSWYVNNPDATEYILTSADQFVGLYELVNNDSIYFNGKTVKLAVNVVLNEGDARTWNASTTGLYEWKPIGKGWTTGFAGTLDGQNHYISGLYCKATVNNALFAFGSNLTIKNLALVNSYQVVPTTGTSTEILASFVGKGAGIHLENLYSDSILEGGYQCVGGIAAMTRGNGNNGATRDCVIKSCVFAGEMRNAKYERVGGILGTDDKGATLIENCLNLGNLNVVSTRYTGGIVGFAKNKTTVRGCVSIGYVNTGFAIIGYSNVQSGVTDTNVYVENCYYVGGDKKAVTGGKNAALTEKVTNTGPIEDILAKGMQVTTTMANLTFGENGWTAMPGDYPVPTGVLELVKAVRKVPGDANVPVINMQPGSFGYATVGDAVTDLQITATSTDGGVLSYQWYVNTTMSNVGGTPITGATQATYTPSLTGLIAGQSKYYYCVVTNTNSAVEGENTASAASYVAVVHIHEAKASWKYSETEHWHECKVDGCNAQLGKEAHDSNNANHVCQCGQVKVSYYDGTSDYSWYEANKTTKTVTLTSASQLYGLADIVNGTNGATQDNLVGWTIKLGANMVLNNGDATTWSKTNKPEYSWAPIGDVTVSGTSWSDLKGYFGGTLDGQGHYISGIYSVRGRDNGFMLYTIDATITDLAVINSYYENDGSSASNGQVLGAIVGRGYGLTLKNVYSNAKVVCSHKDYHTGGLVGFARSNDTVSLKVKGVASQKFTYGTATISNCVFTGEVVAKANDAGSLVGGILGGTDDGFAIIENCLFAGHIESNDNCVGGIAGRIAADKTTNNLDGKTNGAVYGSEIRNCISAGTVVNSGTKTAFGAVLGHARKNSSGDVPGPIVVANCVYDSADKFGEYTYIGVEDGGITVTKTDNEGYTDTQMRGLEALGTLTNLNAGWKATSGYPVPNPAATMVEEQDTFEGATVPFTINGNHISKYTIVWGESHLTALQSHEWYNKTEATDDDKYDDFKQWLTGENGSVTEYNYETALRLQAYIEKICSVKLPIEAASTSTAQYKIVVDSVVWSGVASAELGDVDKYEIYVDGNNLVIKGGSYGATWHALDYLESMDNLILASDYKYTGSYDMITIGMVGDSITHGSTSSLYVWNANNSVSNNLNYTALAYPAQVGRLMWKDVVVYNYAQAGIMLTRYRDGDEWPILQANAPKLDYVTIMLGTNDALTLVENDGMWGADDDKLFFDEYKAIIDTLQGLNPNMKFVMFNSPTCWQKNNIRMVGLPYVLNAQEATYNELSKTHTIGFVDMHTLTAGMKVQFTDDIHPNSEGYVMFANIISDYLKSFMKANG